MPMPEIVNSEVVWPQVPQLLLIDHSSMGAWFQSTPQLQSQAVLFPSRVPSLEISQTYLSEEARGTYLGASAAKAVHQALRLQVGVPALAGGVSLPMEKAEHVWAWQSNQCFVSPRRLQPGVPASSLLLSDSRKDVIWTLKQKRIHRTCSPSQGARMTEFPYQLDWLWDSGHVTGLLRTSTLLSQSG